MAPILIWNRHKKQLEEEIIYGGKLVHFLYQTLLGRWILPFFTTYWISRWVGCYHSSFLSCWKIPRFIKKFKIPLEDFESTPYANFNEFFIRRYRPHVRSFVSQPQHLPAFCEGRYLAYTKSDSHKTVPIKNHSFTIPGLLNHHSRTHKFLQGPVLIARLCPVDYHRFHFPDEGTILEHLTLTGKLHSVNPLALQTYPSILMENERQVTFIQTKHFGELAYIEVGALCVGKIVQTYSTTHCDRGQEKGYFLFGGSTVVLLGEPGAWTPDADLLVRTQHHQETLITLGEKIGSIES